MNRFFLLSGFPLRSLRLCGEKVYQEYMKWQRETPSMRSQAG